MKYTKQKRIGIIGNILIVIFNIILMAGAVTSSYIYTKNMEKENYKLQVDAFCSTVESMKQISQNYLKNEKGYVNDWAAYISANKMTREEAIEYIAMVNTQDDRYAHIVDMDDYSARTTYWRNGVSNWTSCYEAKAEEAANGADFFVKMMNKMFTEDNDELIVLGKYRVGETQQNVISVGNRVELKTDDGDTKPYLLLRVIPVDSLKNTWIFPTEYSDAEIGIITNGGEYVIQSQSMRSKNFLEFIRGYNFEDDYNKMNELEDMLINTSNGLLVYNNSNDEKCYWYYSEFGNNSNLDIIGCIPADSLGNLYINWFIIIAVCGTLLLILFIDILYILSINRRLLRTTKVAKQASEAKTQFLSSMSHDIRTPMNAVIGMTDIAIKHIDDKEYVRECLNKVSSAGNHLITLINDILDISQVESGKMILNPEPFSLSQAVEDIKNILAARAEEKELDFRVNMHNIKYDGLVADRLRLNQIFINLLNNAVKYTEAGGEIIFDVSEEDIAVCTDNKNGKNNIKEPAVRLVCVVKDTGIGMSEEFQQQMYSSFSREKDGRIDKIQGSGLGLAIVKELVDLMDGTIECKSALKEGTEFTVKLDMPLSDTAALAVQSEVSEKKAYAEVSEGAENVTDKALDKYEDIKGMRVLIAEDNDINWEIIQIMLEDYGVICDRAEDGRKCVDMLENSDTGYYSVVLMDIQMPVMNGKEAADVIRKSSNQYVKDIPIYAMTADAFAEDVKDSIAHGMNGHIAKPVDIKKVLEVLKNIQYKA